jgi:cell division septal protein FtsQ
MERDIRTQRQETLYAQREARKHFIEIVAFLFLGVVVISFIIFMAWLFSNRGEF